MALSKDQILSANDLPRIEVQVPEWGGSVFVRTLTAAERDEFEEDSLEKKGKSREVNLTNMRARFCQLVMVNEQGQNIFDETEVIALGRKSSKALNRVWTAGQKLSGLTEEDVEELAKN